MYWEWRWTIVQTKHKKIKFSHFNNRSPSSTSLFLLHLSLISHFHLGSLFLIFVLLCFLLLLFLNNCLFPLSPAWLPALLSHPPPPPQLQLPWPIWLIKTPEVGHCHDHRPFMLHTHIYTQTLGTHVSTHSIPPMSISKHALRDQKLTKQTCSHLHSHTQGYTVQTHCTKYLYIYRKLPHIKKI